MNHFHIEWGGLPMDMMASLRLAFYVYVIDFTRYVVSFNAIFPAPIRNLLGCRARKLKKLYWAKLFIVCAIRQFSCNRLFPLSTPALYLSLSLLLSVSSFFSVSLSLIPLLLVAPFFFVVLLFHCLNALFSCGIFGQQIEQDSQLDVGYVNEISIWWASNTHARARFVYIFDLIVFFSRLYFLSSFTIESLHEFSATFCDGIDGVCH